MNRIQHCGLTHTALFCVQWWRHRHIAIGRSDKSNHRTGDDKAHWQAAHVAAIKKRLLWPGISAGFGSQFGM